MKLPEEEQKAYEHYQDDLHYQASMFESSFVDGYSEGKTVGEEAGKIEANKQTVLNMIKKGYSIKIIAEVTELTEAEIERILK